jgi:hypothetical protein
MESVPKVELERFVEAMKEDMERYLKKVIGAVNDAPDGDWIGGSEEQVRDLSAEFRRLIFETAMQMKIDAAEAAFPPSTRSDNGEASGEQRPANADCVDRQRTCASEAPVVARGRVGKRRTSR